MFAAQVQKSNTKTVLDTEKSLLESDAEPPAKRQKNTDVPDQNYKSTTSVPSATLEPNASAASENNAETKTKTTLHSTRPSGLFLTTQDLSSWIEKKKMNKQPILSKPWKGMVKGIFLSPKDPLIVEIYNRESNKTPPWNCKCDPITNLFTLNLPIDDNTAEALNKFQQEIINHVQETYPEMFSKDSSPEHYVLAKKKDDYPYNIGVKFENGNQNPNDATSQNNCIFTVVDSSKNATLQKDFNLDNLKGALWKKAAIHIRHVCSTNGKWSIRLQLRALVLEEQRDIKEDFMEFSLLSENETPPL